MYSKVSEIAEPDAHAINAHHRKPRYFTSSFRVRKYRYPVIHSFKENKLPAARNSVQAKTLTLIQINDVSGEMFISADAIVTSMANKIGMKAA